MNKKTHMDLETLIKKLQYCTEIHPENYEDIDTGTWIKYINKDNQYRSGGQLLINKAINSICIKKSIF